jgi:plastocyanin
MAVRNRLAALVAACGLALAASPAPVVARDVTIRIADFEFTPARVTVVVGDRVEWIMGPDPEQHTVTPDRQGAFPGSAVLQPGDPGDRHTVSFRRPGRYAYHCELHPNMTGVVTVVAAPGTTPSPSPSAPPVTPSVGPSAGTLPTGTIAPSAPPSPSPGTSPEEVPPSRSPPTASPATPAAPPGAELGVPAAFAAVIAAVLASVALLGLGRRRPR